MAVEAGMETEWQRFEKLTRDIQAQLAPSANVQHNEVVVGKSGAQNQLDVTLRAKIGQYEFFCVIECKNWAQKVDIDTLRAFSAKLDDVGAMQGVMVSANGYTSQASTFAQAKNIKLYKLVDAEAERWKDAALIPIVLAEISLEEANLELIDSRTGNKVWLVDASGHRAPDEKVYLFELKKNRYVKVKDFLEQQWDSIFTTREPKPDEWFETNDGEFLLFEGGEKHAPVRARYSLKARKIWYYGHLSLKKCVGFLEDGSGKLVASTYESNPLEFREILKSWPRTSKKAEIPFSAEHTFFMGHFFSKRDRPAPEAITLEKRWPGSRPQTG